MSHLHKYKRFDIRDMFYYDIFTIILIYPLQNYRSLHLLSALGLLVKILCETCHSLLIVCSINHFSNNHITLTVKCLSYWTNICRFCIYQNGNNTLL